MTQEEIKYHNQLWYYKTYNQLIDKCIQMESEGYPEDMYTEVHHILPRCMGGTNKKDNLVRMPVRYHVIAHMLLANAYRYSKLMFAVNAMFTGLGKEFKERYEVISKFSTRLISKFREEYKISLRESGIKLNDGNIAFKSKEVICFDIDINVIKIYSSLSDVKLDGFHPSTVRKHCISKEEYAGYYWNYIENFEKDYLEKLITYYENVKQGIIPELDNSYANLTYSEKLKRRKSTPRTEEWKKKISLSNKGKSKKIINTAFSNKGRSRKVIAPNNIIYENIKIASMEYKISEKTLRKWIKNYPEKGFKFVDEDKIIVDPDNKHFSTLQDCANYYKVSKTAISNWIKDPNKNFRYIDINES